MTRTCHVHHLGLVPYQEAWDLQNRLAGEIASGDRPPTLLLLEHPHTYTFGRSGRIENLLWDEDELARRGISVHWVDRGGDVTYHGPGQLVGYPLIPLGTTKTEMDPQQDSAHIPQVDYIGYLRQLESVLIAALASFGLASVQYPGLTGVWIQPHKQSPSIGSSQGANPLPTKIAAIGVKVDARGVSRHGFALNVQQDKAYWEGIIGCGLEDYQVTCIAELLIPAPTIDSVAKCVIAAFGEEFDYRMEIKPP